MPTYCCDSKCFMLSKVEVDGLACRRCQAYGQCYCLCKSYKNRHMYDPRDRITARFGVVWSMRLEDARLDKLQECMALNRDGLLECQYCHVTFDHEDPMDVLLLSDEKLFEKMHKLCRRNWSSTMYPYESIV